MSLSSKINYHYFNLNDTFKYMLNTIYYYTCNCDFLKKCHIHHQMR